jgi:predicted helicase
MKTIHDILIELAQAAISNWDKGDKFERLMVGYLKTDPLYTSRFSDVWRWAEWPDRVSGNDTGIDLVAQERETGEFCAIQCKFYDEVHDLQKSDIDSFFTASGKKPFTSRIIISTSDRWSKNAEDALIEQRTPVIRIRVQDLDESPVDWSQFSLDKPDRVRLKPKKHLRPHQRTALNETVDGFKSADRGKLIMACGTGKTFVSLKIAETLASTGGNVLFLAPSISLISQSLKEWTAEADLPLRCYAVCSDAKVGKRGSNEDMSVHDLALPASTNARTLATHFQKSKGGKRLTVIFSTYQSIKVIHEAQKLGVPKFDLVICDEAHRTTGMVLPDEDESHFVRVHDAEYIKAKKRLYMTATPRIYSDASQSQAKENDIELCSMGDEALYGKEFHRLGFAEAVTKGLLSDYKVLVLAVDEKFVSKTFQRQLADSNNELTLDDAVKIVGCWNGLSKHSSQSETFEGLGTDTAPMRRAVAFSRSIKDSKTIVSLFSQIVQQYRNSVQEDEPMLDCEVRHVDGTFNVLLRNNLLDWLKADTSGQGNMCRILSNARCLSEGVDVPALDAVMFLNPRDSVVDVVQSVGRVMRKVEGKQYGYIILPVGIPADTTPEKALEDNKRYKVVWQVLQALRAHDDRFNAMINKLDLNKATSDNLQIIGVGGGEDKDLNAGTVTAQIRLSFPEIEEWREAIYAKIVLKCGDRRYWETWAADIAVIAQRHIERITLLLAEAGTKPRNAFDHFLSGLHKNLNPSVTEAEAIEMLAQHLITKPVFDALFEGYQFTQQNPVSVSMQKILGILEGQALEKETATLEKFYASVRDRASGIDNAEGKQKIIVELYDKFFRVAFKDMVERLGIVYTPIEVVDFIIHSVDDALRQEFGASLSDKGVHVLDPFTGTGTFMVRLLQSGLIKQEDFLYKYQNELHANEIVLLAYYLAAINIEETFHGIAGGEFLPFEGIVLTDTFQMTENYGMSPDLIFSENNERATRQKGYPIRVILGNPPYSVGQESANDVNQNLKYPRLDEAIRKTYAKRSTATNKNSLYNSYIRAFRWSSDRIKDKGIVCFVSSSFVDANSADGLRKCVTDEFTSIYCFNLRGNARTQGEVRRKEAGNVFGGGSRSPIAITLMVKNPEKPGPCELHYYDIGDYLSREEKLKIISEFTAFRGMSLSILHPNADGDWINPRDPQFEEFVPLGDKSSDGSDPLFGVFSMGVKTNRDAWAYNYSHEALASNMSRMIAFYNGQSKSYALACKRASEELDVDGFIETDARRISWNRSLKNDLKRGNSLAYEGECIVRSHYRPFTKQWLYFNRSLNDMVYRMPSIFPNVRLENLVISATGLGASREFSVLISDSVPNLHLQDTGQCFPLYYYVSTESKSGNLFEDAGQCERRDAISDSALRKFLARYDAKIKKEDVFYYVYGVLHSPEYKTRFASDLRKMLPRVPLARDFWAFSKAGRKLAKWHLEYESVEPYPVEETISGPRMAAAERYRVSKMSFAKKDGKPDKSVIVYNSHVTLSGIPLGTYDYIVNGKPALEWIMERYQVTTDKDSGIKNDPNEWSANPRYIVDLVKRIVRVSLETVKIVSGLPALQEDKAKARA